MSLDQEILQAFENTKLGLRAQTEFIPTTYELEGHPKLSKLIVIRQGGNADFLVLLVTPEGGYVRPQEIDEDVTDATKEAFLGVAGRMSLDATAWLLNGYRSEALDTVNGAKFQAELDALEESGDVTSAPTIVEPGYSCKEKGALFANWNPISSELQAWLEEQGYTMHWSDEWVTCDECGAAFRCNGDSYTWTQYGTIDDNGCTCGNCIKKDPETYLLCLEGSNTKAVTINGINPTDHGYVKVNTDTFESGWHPGQTDDPKKIGIVLRSRGITRYVFGIASVGQFDVNFDVYIPKEQEGLLDEIRAALRG